jgi:hypothetical protein
MNAAERHAPPIGPLHTKFCRLAVRGMGMPGKPPTTRPFLPIGARRGPSLNKKTTADVGARHVAARDGMMVGMADSVALRSRRKRRHAAGDHSECRPGCERRLRVATVDDVSGLRASVAVEFGADDEVVRALALRLATIAEQGHGVAAVTALRALGELIAAQR